MKKTKTKGRQTVAALQASREQSAATKAALAPVPAQISADELQEFLEASQQLSTAQGIYNFVSGRLIRKYGLTPVDTFDTTTGKITRGKVE
jgi:hypothetical protein